MHQVPALGHHPKWFSSREIQCIQYHLAGYIHSLLLTVFQSSSGPQLWRNLAFLASVQDGRAYQMSFLSLIDNDNKSKAITYKILSSLRCCWILLAQPPSLTSISDTVSYFLARAFSKTWKKPKIYRGSVLPFYIFFSTSLFLFFSDKTPLDSLKKNDPLTLFLLSVLTEGLG